VFFDGGGVWNQNAATDFQLYNQSYGTRLRRGNDHSSIDVLICTHTGVVLKGQGTWNQNSDTTITVSQGRGTTNLVCLYKLLVFIIFVKQWIGRFVGSHRGALGQRERRVEPSPDSPDFADLQQWQHRYVFFDLMLAHWCGAR
jgi:hypothetical protein